MNKITNLLYKATNSPGLISTISNNINIHGGNILKTRMASIDNEFNPLIPNPSTSSAPYRIFNIGNSHPTQLTYFIELLEKNLGKKAIKNFQPMQPGDVVSTAARMDLLNSWVEYKPTTSIENGIKLFSEWYLEYFKNTY